MNKKFIVMTIIFPLLISCSGQKKTFFNEKYTKDTNGFDILMEQFAANIENIWGINEVLIAGIKDYVKYSNDYHTRGHIDFENGRIIIETISNINPMRNLHKAIINMLLIGSYPDNVDLHEDINNIRINKEPLLYDQVLDNTGQPIRWQKRASSFADYLIQNKLKKRTSGLNVIWSICIPMIPNHLDKRAHKYLPLVRKAAEEYSIDASLILAIMQIESSFNPYAVSHSDALGLMQVVQHTAGIDVFRMKGRWGKPSRSYLFNPKNNIDVGAAYLSLLQNTYLGKIEDPLSRRYAVITAYNGGVNSVLRVFSSNRDHAFSTINNMSPSEVYQILTSNHPSVESRLYLNKVNSAQRSYDYF